MVSKRPIRKTTARNHRRRRQNSDGWMLFLIAGGAAWLVCLILIINHLGEFNSYFFTPPHIAQASAQQGLTNRKKNAPPAITSLTSSPESSTQIDYPTDETQVPGVEVALTPTKKPKPTLSPDQRDAGDWQNWPVVPTVTNGALKVYARGKELGNNAHAFSKIGDCETVSNWFLTDFDNPKGTYSLGQYSNLEGVIKQFSGSFSRTSIAAFNGASAASIMSPLWANKQFCQPDESPLQCEFRMNSPRYIIINLGTNDNNNPQGFEDGMRKIIEYSMDQGVVPILATKADNREGGNAFNALIARLGVEYDLPVWNFWAAVQSIPNHGLEADGNHLTYADNYFNDEYAMQHAWPIRNLTALQTLDSIWRGIGSHSLSQ